MLSFGLPEINSAATFLAASKRLGFKSSASIEVDTSIANIISMPSTERSSQALWVWGRAKTQMIKMKARHLNTIGACTKRVRQLFGANR